MSQKSAIPMIDLDLIKDLVITLSERIRGTGASLNCSYKLTSELSDSEGNVNHIIQEISFNIK